ncbi:MAG: M48 family metallopeptidase, partial [Methylophilaceae bacterium]|nr:M48 family metallopeptidase [Methylophilaceae bacterium]
VIYPTLIAPWFNTFSPLQNDTLQARIETLLSKCGFQSKGLFVMNGSARSNHGNAYFTGFGSTKRVVFFDTLLERLEVNEIEAVLAHELGHFKHNHLIKRIILVFGLSFFGLWVLYKLENADWFYSALGLTQSSPHLALALFLLLSPLALTMLQPLLASYSRKNEFEADRYAATYVNPQHLRDALVKLYRDNAATLTPDWLYSAFYDSHPPATIRIAKLSGVTQR